MIASQSRHSGFEYRSNKFRGKFVGTVACLVLASIAVACKASSTRPLLPLPVRVKSAQAVPLSSDPNHFTFLLSGDNRSTARGVPMPPTTEQICREMRLHQPAFALWTGDTIYGSDDSLGEAEAEYDVFLQTLALAATPIFNAPGNHEIYDRPELAQLYAQKMGRLYGSFDYGNSHFIALNTEEVGAKGGVSEEQRTWLKQDLEANRGAKHRFVFMHHPLYPRDPKEQLADPETVTMLHRLFVQYNVQNVISGHEHGYYKSVHDGITYWVTGGAGAPTSGTPEEGGFQHYILMAVDGDQVTGTVLEPWRLFTTVGPVGSDGTCTARIDNYDGVELSLCVEFTVAPSPGAMASASSTYKGKTKPLPSAIVTSRVPGVVTVRVQVPAHRSAVVTLIPNR